MPLLIARLIVSVYHKTLVVLAFLPCQPSKVVAADVSVWIDHVLLWDDIHRHAVIVETDNKMMDAARMPGRGSAFLSAELHPSVPPGCLPRLSDSSSQCDTRM